MSKLYTSINEFKNFINENNNNISTIKGYLEQTGYTLMDESESDIDFENDQGSTFKISVDGDEVTQFYGVSGANGDVYNIQEVGNIDHINQITIEFLSYYTDW